MMGSWANGKRNQPLLNLYWSSGKIKEDCGLTSLKAFFTSNLQMACCNSPSSDRPPAHSPCVEID
jgi:hypothetical protein